jgi:putative membrane protein
VFCAIFGLYQPLMEVLAHPIKNIKKHWKLLLPVIIGVAIGFLTLAKVVNLLYAWNEGGATALFLGLIIGELPSLWQEAGEQGPRRRSSYIGMAAAFCLSFAILLILELGTEFQITPNPLWYGVSGCLIGLGVVVPGMSGAAPLTFMGLYEPLTQAIEAVMDSAVGFLGGNLTFMHMLVGMNFGAIIPIGIGLLIPFVLIAKPINYLLGKKPSLMYHMIFGIVVGTTLPILLFKLSLAEMPLLKLGFVLLGFLIAWLIDRVSRKYV